MSQQSGQPYHNHTLHKHSVKYIQRKLFHLLNSIVGSKMEKYQFIRNILKNKNRVRLCTPDGFENYGV